MTDAGAKIRTKKEFFRLASAGLLGNQMPSWPDAESAIRDGHTGEVMVRCKEPDSPLMRPNVPVRDAERVIGEFVASGKPRGQFYLTWMSPYVGRLLNAEAWRAPGGLYLNYSRSQTHLRDALDHDGHHAEGLRAVLILQGACDPNSMDDLRGIWERYPDAVIELTAFDRQIGSLPGRNTVVWEVRDY